MVSAMSSEQAFRPHSAEGFRRPDSRREETRLVKRRRELVHEVVGSLLVEKVVSMLHDHNRWGSSTRSGLCGQGRRPRLAPHWVCNPVSRS